MLTLITGGARSGKSRFAQSLCSPAARTCFLATARVEDEEMRRRVQQHRADRPPGWTTVEEPLGISKAALGLKGQVDVILLDCLTLWTSNLLLKMSDAPLERVETAAFRELDALIDQAKETRMVLVTNEVGSGIVPESALGRNFRDLHGWINQRVAAQANEVYLMVAGVGLRVKSDTEQA